MLIDRPFLLSGCARGAAPDRPRTDPNSEKAHVSQLDGCRKSSYFEIAGGQLFCKLKAPGHCWSRRCLLRSSPRINQNIVAMYTQQMRTQCFGVSSRRVLAPSVSRSLVGRQSAHSCRRPAARRTGIKPQAVQAPAKRELPTKGIDYKPKNDQTDVQTDIVKKLAYVVGANANSVSEREAYQGVALSVRERLIERFNKTQEHWRCATNPANNTSVCTAIFCHYYLTRTKWETLLQAKGPQVHLLPFSRVPDGTVFAEHGSQPGTRA